jgi:hypothetical protein
MMSIPPPWIEATIVALPRRMGVILQRMRVEGRDSGSDDPAANMAKEIGPPIVACLTAGL